MSDFGDNPFGDPKASSSSNPFSDPSVQQARSTGYTATNVQDFNPFEKGAPTTGPSGITQPAVLPTTASSVSGPSLQPPPYTANIEPQQPRINSEDLERRQRELEAKARELERREEEQRQREQDLNASGFRSKNWPPLPSFSPIGPCFYQDIDLEIPLEFRRLVRLAYYLWMAHATVLVLNIIGAIAYFVAIPNNKTNAGTVFGVSIIVCVVFTPASFVCWFRPLYKAFKSDSCFNFFLFFLMLFVQFAILVIQCLGLDYLGSCGWINALVMMADSKPVGVLMLLIALLFTAMAVLDLLLLIRVHRIYRSTGASFAKARQEFSEGVLSNEAVRGAAADAAAATARSAFSGGSGGGGGGGRY